MPIGWILVSVGFLLCLKYLVDNTNKIANDFRKKMIAGFSEWVTYVPDLDDPDFVAFIR